MHVEENVKLKTIQCDGKPKDFFDNLTLTSSKVASIVAVPDQFHFLWIKNLLLKKIPVLTVKPLTLNLRESIELKNLSEEFNIPVYVEFHKRYDKQSRYAKDIFSSNKLPDKNFQFIFALKIICNFAPIEKPINLRNIMGACCIATN